MRFPLSKVVLYALNTFFFRFKLFRFIPYGLVAPILSPLYLLFSNSQGYSSIIFFAQKYNCYDLASELFIDLIARKPGDLLLLSHLQIVYFYQGRISLMLESYKLMLNRIMSQSYPSGTLFLSSYFTYSIGHIALIAYLALSIELGLSPFTRISICIAVGQTIANQFLLDAIAHRFCDLIDILEVHDSSPFPYLPNALSLPLNSGTFFQTKALQLVIARYRTISTKPVLRTQTSHRDSFFSWLNTNNIPPFQWFCTVHLRSRVDGSTRSSSIDLIPHIISTITSLGGVTFIIGDYYKDDPSLGDGSSFYIPSSKDTTGAIHTFLLANARFSIHSPSGPVVVSSSLFSVPTIQVDLIPTRNFLGSNVDFAIPKVFYSSCTGEILPLSYQLQNTSSYVTDEHVSINGVTYYPKSTPPSLLKTSIHQMYTLTLSSTYNTQYKKLRSAPQNQRFSNLLDPHSELGVPCLPDDFSSFYPHYLH